MNNIGRTEPITAIYNTGKRTTDSRSSHQQGQNTRNKDKNHGDASANHPTKLATRIHTHGKRKTSPREDTEYSTITGKYGERRKTHQKNRTRRKKRQERTTPAHKRNATREEQTTTIEINSQRPGGTETNTNRGERHEQSVIKTKANRSDRNTQH